MIDPKSVGSERELEGEEFAHAGPDKQVKAVNQVHCDDSSYIGPVLPVDVWRWSRKIVAEV